MKISSVSYYPSSKNYSIYIRESNSEQRSKIIEYIKDFDGKLGMFIYATNLFAYIATFSTKEQAEYFKALLELEQ